MNCSNHIAKCRPPLLGGHWKLQVQSILSNEQARDRWSGTERCKPNWFQNRKDVRVNDLLRWIYLERLCLEDNPNTQKRRRRIIHWETTNNKIIYKKKRRLTFAFCGILICRLNTSKLATKFLYATGVPLSLPVIAIPFSDQHHGVKKEITWDACYTHTF